MMIQCTTDGIGTNKFDLLYSLSMNAVILVFSQMTRISMIFPNSKATDSFKKTVKNRWFVVSGQLYACEM